jgi:hypothetical protein
MTNTATFKPAECKESKDSRLAPNSSSEIMEFSGMTQKWSYKLKENKAARIRSNQRCHRARTKAYIADLERQLVEVRDLL